MDGVCVCVFICFIIEDSVFGVCVKESEKERTLCVRFTWVGLIISAVCVCVCEIMFVCM